MRIYDFKTNYFEDDRRGVTFYDLTKQNDTRERLDELEEQVTILSYRGMQC